MPKVTVTIPHQHQPQEAIDRIQPAIKHVLEAFNASNVEMTWTDQIANFKCSSMGFPITGVANVAPELVTVDVTLPFAAAMFKGNVEKSLTKHLTKALQIQ